MDKIGRWTKIIILRRTNGPICYHGVHGMDRPSHGRRTMVIFHRWTEVDGRKNTDRSPHGPIRTTEHDRSKDDLWL